MGRSYWLLKTEPETYSFEQLLKDGKTNWNGVRNFQARNFLKTCARGDLALIYHSGGIKAVVGIAEVTRDAYSDPDPKKPGEWFQIDLAPVKALRQLVTLAEIKAEAILSTIHLIKQSRLSVMPVTAAHYAKVLKMGGEK
jgi:predicted RNA-binding protein with PUA-like domain